MKESIKTQKNMARELYSFQMAISTLVVFKIMSKMDKAHTFGRMVKSMWANTRMGKELEKGFIT